MENGWLVGEKIIGKERNCREEKVDKGRRKWWYRLGETLRVVGKIK